MVAVLLRLRFRVLANSLRRDTFQLVAVIVGGMLALALVAAACGVMLLASLAPPAATQAIVVVGGSALVLGWLIVPLLFDGVDRTLDPLKLARFPVRTAQLMTAMFLVGVAWLPGIATLAVSLATAIAWRSHPVSAFAALAAGLVGAATCVAGSRLTTSAVGTLLRRRGAMLAAAAVGVLLLVGPIAFIALGGGAGRSDDTLSDVAAAIGVLGWTPLGAVWSIPGRLALGDTAGATGAAAVAIGTLIGVVALWRLTLDAGLRVRGDRAAHTGRGSGLGPLGWMPATPVGAVAARSLVYWFKDARQSRQLLLLPVLPALMLLWWHLFDLPWIALAAGPVVASLLPLSAFATLSYDGTAFAAELAAGVRGIHDRLGRAVALICVAGPATVLVQVVIVVIIDRVADLPALLGLSLGVLLVSVGVVSVSSARVIVPVARSGRNPFSSQPGAATTSIFASYGVALATVVLALPVVALAVAALITSVPALGWLALIASLVLGSAITLGGVALGGRMLDASGPAMLARLRVVRA